MQKIQVNLCGATSIVDANGQQVDKVGGVKPRQVLQLLALSAGSPMSKDRIADLLWDGAPPPSYLGTLESYVCLLRRALGLGRGRNSALRTTTTGYVLAADEIDVDVVRVRARLAEARLDVEQRIRLVDEALDMVNGELLASEPYAAWAQEQRACFTRELVTGATDAAETALDAGNTTATIRLARRAVTLEPLAEQAWQLLIRALADEGRQGEALKAYAELREVMLDELGAEPGETSRALYLHVLQGMRRSDRTRTDRHELSTLISLLRQALESVPGVELPAGDESLTQIAVRVLAA
jgi:DNA-binding SARP family transcriptional activator